MKNFITLIGIAVCIMSFHPFDQGDQNKIIGIWDTRDVHIEIYKVDGRYIGNPINSGGERNTEIEVLNLEYKNGKWVGKIYSKKRERLLDVLCLVKGNKLLLEVTARFASADLEWTKIK
ncbi:DUF2147 domain-containing protein [Reichenbachiella faecimaris]|nr:hypothetical protein [Reichenbachiella faecimaris]